MRPNINCRMAGLDEPLSLRLGGMTEHSAHNLAKGFSSRSIHAGYHPDPHMGSINVPIYASTTFAQDGLAQLRGGFEYGRVANPTVASLAKTIAALEGAEFASSQFSPDSSLR